MWIVYLRSTKNLDNIYFNNSQLKSNLSLALNILVLMVSNERNPLLHPALNKSIVH